LKEKFSYAFYSNAREEYVEEELYEVFNEPDIIKRLKINRLIWTGHIIRVKNSKLVKNVFSTRPGGSRGILEGPN
jgi:hypothetical protein